MVRYPRLRRLGEWYTSIAVALLTCVFLALVLEGAWRTVRPSRKDNTDPRAKLSYYTATGWGRQYWKEFDGSLQYVPYTLWRHNAMSGRFLQVDSTGVRRTPGADCRPSAYMVYAFGGSTMWGSGAPDDGTIPAVLQREISSRTNRPVCVVNLGEGGYVSTQEVVDLLLRLQKGARPDLVVFYDGINDVFVTYQGGPAGVHQNLDQFQVRFGGSVAMRLHFWFDSHSRLYKSINGRVARRPTYNTRAEREHRTREAGDAYLANYHLVDALSRQYGFEYVFFLQPVSYFAPKRLNAEEREMVAEHIRRAGPSMLYFSAFVVYVEERSRGLPNFHSLTRVLEGAEGYMWSDWVHMTPEGNRSVALAMMPAIERLLPDSDVAR